MNIRFNSIHIVAFKSLSECQLVLDNRGIVAVVGQNDYDACVKSNGAGKSSIFNALYWCFYGKTPDGVSNPTNKYTKAKCCVELNFEVDSGSYTVVRSVTAGGTQSVEVVADGTVISARNKTENDKYIRETLLQMPPDIFSSLVYLTQGFANRLSVLTPAARKQQLETITATSKYVDEFAHKLSEIRNSYDNEVRHLDMKLAANESARQVHEASIQKCNKSLQEAAAQLSYIDVDTPSGSKRYTSDDLPQLTANLSRAESSLTEVSNMKINADSNAKQCKANIQLNKQRLAQLNSQSADIRNSIVNAAKKKCPVCHQNLSDAFADEYCRLQQSKLSELESDIQATEKAIKALELNLPAYECKVNEYMTNYTQLQQVVSTLRSIIRQIPSDKVDTKALEDMIADADQHINVLATERSDLQNLRNDAADYMDVAAHCYQLASKQFRAYLLKQSVDFMNARLMYYSTKLFSNESDVIAVKSDSTKLEISLGEYTYEELSGGEKRRVDLALMLAQRDLAFDVAGIQSNILILDEVMDNLDETATMAALELLQEQSTYVATMFIVSHNNYSLPVDSKIVVQKSSDRIANVVEM